MAIEKPFFAVRRRRAELMDDPAVDPREHQRALRGLRRINRLSRADSILFHAVRSFAPTVVGRPIRILDIATGSGDNPINLARRCRRAGIAVRMFGCDFSETAVATAREQARACGEDVEFFTADVVSGTLPERYDVVMCSLFLHHLDDESAGKVLKTMKNSSDGLVIVNDLNRCRLGWWAAYLGTRILSRSPIVHFDGPVSVEGAYTPEEARQLAESAGLHGARVTRCFPWRFRLTWQRGSAGN